MKSAFATWVFAKNLGRERLKKILNLTKIFSLKIIVPGFPTPDEDNSAPNPYSS